MLCRVRNQLRQRKNRLFIREEERIAGRARQESYASIRLPLVGFEGQGQCGIHSDGPCARDCLGRPVMRLRLREVRGRRLQGAFKRRSMCDRAVGGTVGNVPRAVGAGNAWAAARGAVETERTARREWWAAASPASRIAPQAVTPANFRQNCVPLLILQPPGALASSPVLGGRSDS